MIKTLAERFWAKVDKNGPIPANCPHLGPCWLWTASTDSKGYGQINAGRKGERILRAHRVSWLLNRGALSAEALLLHACDNRSCVNPDHLRIGSHKDNMADRDAHGINHQRCEKNPIARLTYEQVVAIRAEYVPRPAGMIPGLHIEGNKKRRAEGSVNFLAEKYGVNYGTIWAVVHHKTWRVCDQPSNKKVPVSDHDERHGAGAWQA